MKAVFNLTNFQILLLEGKSVLGPAQQSTGSERIKCEDKHHDEKRNIHSNHDVENTQSEKK